METTLVLQAILIPLALFCVFLASLPTGIDILRRGNEADPLRREIEEESRRGERTRDGSPPPFL